MQYQILEESRQKFVTIRKHDLAMTKSGHIFANGSYLREPVKNVLAEFVR